MKEVEVIEIHSDDLVLRIVTLQLHSNDPFDGLLKGSLHSGVGCLGEKLLSQLLGDGRTSTSILLPHESTFDDGTSQSIEVDAGMLVETFILSSHQGLDE